MIRSKKKAAGNSFKNNVGSVFGARILVCAVEILTSVYLARALGPEGKGKFAVVTSVYSIALQFGNLGMHTAHTYYISKDRNAAAGCEGNVLLMTLFSCMMLFFAVPFFSAHEELLGLDVFLVCIAFFLVPFSMLIMLQEHMFIAINEVKYYNWTEFLYHSLFPFITVILSIFFRATVELVSVSLLAAVMMISIYSLLIYFQRIKGAVRVSVGYLFKIMPYGIKSYCASLVIFLVLKADILMLNYFCSDFEVGIYSLAVSLAEMSYMLSSSIALVLFPKLGTLSSLEEKKHLLKKVLWVSTPLLCIVYFFMGILARCAVRMLYGVQYLDAVPILIILMPGAFCWASADYFFKFFSSENRLLPAIVVPFVSLLVNILLNYYLIPREGNRGAAAASTCSYMVCFTGMIISYFYYVHRAEKLERGNL